MTILNPKLKKTKEKKNKQTKMRHCHSKLSAFAAFLCVCVGNIIKFEVLSCYHEKLQLNQIDRLVVLLDSHLKLQEGTWNMHENDGVTELVTFFSV